jgi:protein-L-isoaspartate(D-aspartate) O-methyltransferase
MDFERARFNMVEQQIRPWDVLDDSVLSLLFKIKREDYVPATYRALAFTDMEIPLGHGQSMWTPKLEARLVQELRLKPTDKVLEVGTGSGYVTALLASLAKHVHSVEIVPEFKAEAEARLNARGFDNVTLEAGDAVRGWPMHAPYDAILLTGSVPELPEELIGQLNSGGRLIAIVGEAPVMQARLVRLIEPGVVDTRTLFETVVAPLANAPVPERFVF